VERRSFSTFYFAIGFLVTFVVGRGGNLLIGMSEQDYSLVSNFRVGRASAGVSEQKRLRWSNYWIQ